MRAVNVFAFAMAVAGSAVFAMPASAQRVCSESCVGPLCNRECVQRDRYRDDFTVGRGQRDVIIEERGRYRGPAIEIERNRRGGVDVEVER